MAALTLWVGLTSKEADARSYAVEVLTETIQDGRAHPQPLGEILVRLANCRWFKLNRIAESITEVAHLSPQHRRHPYPLA